MPRYYVVCILWCKANRVQLRRAEVILDQTVDDVMLTLRYILMHHDYLIPSLLWFGSTARNTKLLDLEASSRRLELIEIG